MDGLLQDKIFGYCTAQILTFCFIIVVITGVFHQICSF